MLLSLLNHILGIIFLILVFLLIFSLTKENNTDRQLLVYDDVAYHYCSQQDMSHRVCFCICIFLQGSKFWTILGATSFLSYIWVLVSSLNGYNREMHFHAEIMLSRIKRHDRMTLCHYFPSCLRAESVSSGSLYALT